MWLNYELGKTVFRREIADRAPTLMSLFAVLASLATGIVWATSCDDGPGPGFTSDADTDTDSDADTDSDTDTAIDTDTETEPAPCAGVLVAGACWYLGELGQPCGPVDGPDPVCAGHGGYSDATAEIAGSEGTYEQCEAVLDSLGVPAGLLHVSEASNLGCAYRYVDGNPDAQYRVWAPAVYTSELASSPYDRRACACAE